MIQVTLPFASAAVAAAALQLLADNGFSPEAARTIVDVRAAGNATPVPTFDPKSDKTQAIPREVIEEARKVATAPQADTSAPAVSTPQPTASPVETPKPDAPAAAGLSYENDVKPIVIKVGAAGKRDALVDLLKKFGVAKGPEVPADKLPAFKAELEALVA